ncbi:MAG: hypothetical protein WC393_02615 [Candidatus Nanoarchaeia archaeon]
MNKQIMGIVATLLMIGTALSPAPELSRDISFNITIQKDASITISNLCLNATEQGQPLKFEPGINGLDEDEYALAKNVCAENGTYGYWNISNVGNINAYLSLAIQSDLTGIIIAVGNSSDYVAINYVNLTTVPISWVTAPIIKNGGTTNFWQRVAADATATVGEATNKVIITSSPE